MHGLYTIALMAEHGAVPQCSICTGTIYIDQNGGGGITICLDRKMHIATEPAEIAIILCANCALNLQAQITAQLNKIDRRIELIRKEHKI